ncbi:tripartite ATP-independent transporter solute receptor, DctP family [Rhizobiales bacterium GAS191]|nr:tripartite ATP-independent transporter solute receptor, DctP family [Rhizobiales bacterium GAS191]SEE78399.1 tripartite ATP-independent transporter solute receptor, DctP family [Rhizobiales bacterium GAS188]
MPSATRLSITLAARLLTSALVTSALVTSAFGIALLEASNPVLAQEAHHYSFGYDQPHTTGYGIAADLFNAKLSEMSHGTMVIDQFPGSQLGQEPQMLQKIRTGDIDFMISSTANAATVAPESGVLSIHYIFRSEDQLIKAIADPRLFAAVKELFDDTVKDGHVLTLATLGLRDMYGKKEIRKVEDLQGEKVRVQATPTEDTIFPAYGAQTVHMPFGSVYTSLQTGVVNLAENGVNVYDSNKHYEVAPVLSMTGHEANNSVIWVSDKVWKSLSDEQKGWVQAAATEVGQKEPAQAIALDHKSLDRLQKLGVKVVTDVDKTSFIKLAEPLQDKLAAGLGPHAVKILQITRSIQ